ncbi:putative 37S ribosomal protein S28, mitochondrial [Zancudomyces culisetae]|uniref:Putative 37S ribosomal protein S28, mitochondrial n=1 Tax=Zancudomyces culisetae TaxID=1213189 RepID=A0A1R1PH52_ZANCU|nr:putative 37S ribosomal protein S28, mitochondrial [Zancudomyces culisetae]|eukprot:OMH80300.1 putative 37S ribosomal protein S28, mitochondrial [Zancudomyces culisetae]
MEQAENTQADMVSRVVSMCNQDANAVMRYNLGLAIKSFARTEGDTASPEVQGSSFFVTIFIMLDICCIYRENNTPCRSLEDTQKRPSQSQNIHFLPAQKSKNPALFEAGIIREIFLVSQKAGA